MQLRPYQLELANNTEDWLWTKGNDSCMLQSGTGSGKTVTFSSIAKRHLKERDGRIIVLAHRQEIIGQLYNTFVKLGYPNTGIIAPGYPKTNYPIQVGSVQTYTRRNDVACDLLAFDEAHHAQASTYLSIRDRHKDAKFLGLTATPYRLNGKGFSDIFQTMFCGISTLELESKGFLCPAEVYVNPLDINSLRQVGVVAGDYNEEMLDKLMDTKDINADVVDAYKFHAYGKRACVFCVSVKHAIHLAEEFNKSGIRAATLHADLDDEQRRMILRHYALGNIKIITNVAIATEGTDIPCIDCIIWARPTKSLSLYLQGCGRGTRPAPFKTSYILLDCANNVMEHGLPNEEHDWFAHFYGTAKKKGNKKKETLVRVTKSDGEQEIMTLEEMETAFPIGVKGIKMERIDGVFRIPMFNECLKEVTDNGYSKNSAYYRFCEKVRAMGSIPTYMELLAIAKKLGHKQGWAFYESQAWERLHNAKKVTKTLV